MLKRAIQVLTPLGAIAVTLIATASAQAAVLYQVDDGSTESVLGFNDSNCVIPQGTPVADALWLNEFDVEEDANYIDKISLVWGARLSSKPCSQDRRETSGLTAGQGAKVFLYDTDAAGNLRLVRSQDTQVQAPGTNQFVDVAIQRTRITGRKFYVAALLPNQAQGQFPIAIDTNALTAGRSFYLFNSLLDAQGRPLTPKPNFDYNSVSPTAYTAGNFLLRAYGSAKPIPEPAAAIGLIAIGAGVALKRRITRP